MSSNSSSKVIDELGELLDQPIRGQFAAAPQFHCQFTTAFHEATDYFEIELDLLVGADIKRNVFASCASMHYFEIISFYVLKQIPEQIIFRLKYCKIIH